MVGIGALSRRRFQFRLRTLMIVVTAVAMLCAVARWIADRLTAPERVILMYTLETLGPEEPEFWRQAAMEVKHRFDNLDSLITPRDVTHSERDLRFPPSHIEFKTKASDKHQPTDIVPSPGR